MSTSPLRQKIQDEIRAIPEGRTQELYDLVREFRLRARGSNGNAAEVLKLAGSWADMPEKEFSSFQAEIRDRRRLAGAERRRREAGTD